MQRDLTIVKMARAVIILSDACKPRFFLSFKEKNDSPVSSGNRFLRDAPKDLSSLKKCSAKIILY